MNWKGIMSDSGGTAFIPVRVIISVAVGAAIIGLVFMGLQFANETTAQEKVQRACDSLKANLATTVKGDVRDVNNPADSPGSTYHWNPKLPSELSYLGLGVDPDPDNDGRLQGGITDVGNCIYYKTKGGDKQVIWLDGNIKLRGGRKLNGRWALEEPDGYILQSGGTVNLTFEAVEKQSHRYILIRADDGLYTDRIPPDVNITAPATECYLDGPLIVNWTADDDYADISKVDIAYRAVEDSSWTSIASGVENNGTYQITNPFPDSGRYRVRVSAHDGRNTGSDVSEPISYQFPYTTLNAEPCYRGEDAWWITPSSDLSFLTHYAANTYHRIWDEETGWDSWKTGNPILSSRGKYYIEFYSTGNGLNESSPNWEYVNNQTIYVDDTTPVSYAEIEGPATTATKPINIVFLVTTHADMSHEWDYLCDNYYDELISKFVKRKIDCNYVIYGIQNNLYCSGSYWDAGHCSNWGPAVIDVAESYTWEDNAVRVIIPISDEGPYEGGTGHGDKDYEVIEDAINVCNENDVVVYPLEGYENVANVGERMAELAEGTSGHMYDLEEMGNIPQHLMETQPVEMTGIAGSATSATTIWLNISTEENDVPSTTIHYRIKHPNNDWTEWMAGNPGKNVQIRIFKEGQHTIEFYAEDCFRRIEDSKEKTYYVDGTAPVSMVSPKTAELDEGDSLQVEVTEVEDPNDGIGVKEVELYYKVGSKDWQHYGTYGEEPYAWEFTAPETGTYQFKTIAVDMVGNREKQ